MEKMLNEWIWIAIILTAFLAGCFTGYISRCMDERDKEGKINKSENYRVGSEKFMRYQYGQQVVKNTQNQNQNLKF